MNARSQSARSPFSRIYGACGLGLVAAAGALAFRRTVAVKVLGDGRVGHGETVEKLGVGHAEESTGQAQNRRGGQSDNSEIEQPPQAIKASEPDADVKPDSPDDLTKQSWLYVVRKTAREFSKDQCTDLAAALTYYGVLSVFPAAIALMSLVGVVGDGPKTVDTILDVLRDVGASSVADTLEPTLLSLSQTPGAGFALVVGLVAALWSASGYITSFGRAMNRIYEVVEGRPIWKLRPAMLVLTLMVIVLAAVVLAALVVTGPAADAVGDALGLGSTPVLVWDIAKWPVMLGVVVLIVALLYYATPNVKQPKFRWISVGAGLGILVWIVASVGFGFYVANFASYNKTYGSLAGAIVFLLWLWLTNLALLFGAELDAELERARELQGGQPAEDTIQLPARDERGIEKADLKHTDDVTRGRRLRRSRGRSQEPTDIDADH